jgi:hypothetical protein
MALVVKDRVQETSATTGTGTLTLSGAVTGFQTFSSAIGNTNTTYYTIQGGSEWEVGIGTVGAGTLSRDTVLESSNSGSLVNFSAGSKFVFCTYPAEKSVDSETAQTLTNKTISGASNTLSNIGNSSLTNSSITINGTSTSLGGSINVGTVTSVTGTSPVVSSGGATPAISMAAATTSINGYLTSTDWNTFNGKYSVGGALGTPSSGTVTNLTGTASININGTVGATTSNTGKFTTLETNNALAVKFAASSGTIPFAIGATGTIPVDRGIAVYNTAGAAIPFIAYTSSTTQAGYILTSGSTISFVQGSDYRLKENVVDMDKPSVLSRLMLTRPVNFDWKDGSTLHNYGFIAHELQEVFPQSVHGNKDAVNSDGTIFTQGVNLASLTPYLVASIQEIKKQLDEVKAELQTLKNSA